MKKRSFFSLLQAFPRRRGARRKRPRLFEEGLPASFMHRREEESGVRRDQGRDRLFLRKEDIFRPQ